MMREAERQSRHDQAGYGLVSGAQLETIDKRIAIDLLRNRAGDLRHQAAGIERMAELLGAASEHDYLLFAAVLSLFDRR